jgi:4'-phosphopantetheinyl transferase
MVLDDRTIELAILDLAVQGAALTSLTRLLSAEERQRAARFRFDVHRRRYVSGRGQLRRILAHYTGVAPEALVFFYGAQGKPSVEGIEFNLSHSGDVGVVALTRAAPVGVDVERIRAMDDLDGMARISFSSDERHNLQGLSGADKQEAFFRCWTRKEAYVKATGDGLGMPLDSFDVDLGDRPAPIRVASRRSVWFTLPLALGDGIAGAIAIAGSDWRIRHRVIETPANEAGRV